MRILPLLIACAAAGSAAAADLALELAPPGTKAVFGARVKNIVESPLFKEAAGAGAPQISQEWMKLVTFVGFDPLHDIDEVVVAASGESQKTDAIVFLRGRFNVARMAAGAPRELGVPFLGGKGGTSVLALLDSEIAILGDRTAVRAALARRGHASRLDPSIGERIQYMRATFDVWGFGDVPPGFGAQAGAPQGIGDVDRFEVGLRLTDGFEIAADIHSRTPKDAEKLAASLGAVSGMLGLAGEAAPKLNVQMHDGSVKFSMAVSQEEVKKMMAARAAASPQSAPRPVVAGPPLIFGGESSIAASAPPPTDGGTTVVVLPGKK